ncbi:MAG TPA: UDP-N-acetylmuramate:L-alanyl-gamma-D-glutamyl-meso-diaminopimelate ligase, partial [Burkholderiaceae bacterium]
MHLHILGIGGTFMGGLAQLAQANGHRVTGCDTAVYPPMSDQLRLAGIDLIEGFSPDQLALHPDCFVIGNVVTRGNPLMEAILDSGAPFASGPQWLHQNVLGGRDVLAVAGTHGKTTTASMLAWILQHAGAQPGFLIGGVPNDFGTSARIGAGRSFVIEADEYDTAFFDKRSKFVHYFPRIAVLNNLEFDHADIFSDLAAIETQFHHLIRCIRASGRLIVNGADAALARVLERGCWTGVDRFNVPDGWHAVRVEEGRAHEFDVLAGSAAHGRLALALAGEHNRSNALAAIAAASAAGITPERAIEAMRTFSGVRRRLELVGEAFGVTVYDDFAHHPTAIETTLLGLRRRIDAPVGGSAHSAGRLLAVFEPRSNTMRLGSMRQALVESLKLADRVFCYAPREGRRAVAWDASEALSGVQGAVVADDLDALASQVTEAARPGDQVVVM